MPHSSSYAARSTKRPSGNSKGVVSAALAVSLLSLGACATDGRSRDTGERLSDRGKEIGAYGTAWSQGQQDVKKGEKIVEKSNRSLAEGERDLTRARKELAQAEQQISDASATRAAALKRIEDGRVQMGRAEADYATTKSGPSAVDPRY